MSGGFTGSAGESGPGLARIFSSVELAGKEEETLCTGECLQGVEAADLALGKPCLFPLSVTATIAQAFKALKYNKDIAVLSVWLERRLDDNVEQAALSKNGGRVRDRYRCGGLVTALDIICYLASDESLSNPELALKTPLSLLYPSLSHAVAHVHPRTRLCQALDLMLDGVQHLVVPITKRGKKTKPLKIPGPLATTDVPADDYCWVTQEDVLRYLLGCIGTFCPLPMMTLEELGMIDTNVMMVDADSEASKALPLMKRASQDMTAVAVVTGYRGGDLESSLEGARPRLVGDISTHTMRGCNETSAAALATLSVKDFLHYVHDPVGPPQHLVDKVRAKLKHKFDIRETPIAKHAGPPSANLISIPSSLPELDEELDSMSDYSSSDEELSGRSLKGPIGLPLTSTLKLKSIKGFFPRGKALITCRPRSSLVAVMAQALAHRVNHVWITDDEGGLVGIVTYTDIIDVLLSQLHSLE